jgi:hypothetical protein
MIKWDLVCWRKGRSAGLVPEKMSAISGLCRLQIDDRDKPSAACASFIVSFEMGQCGKELVTLDEMALLEGRQRDEYDIQVSRRGIARRRRRAASLPFCDGLRIDLVALGQRHQALLSILYCSTNCLCRCGAAVKTCLIAHPSILWKIMHHQKPGSNI